MRRRRLRRGENGYASSSATPLRRSVPLVRMRVLAFSQSNTPISTKTSISKLSRQFAETIRYSRSRTRSVRRQTARDHRYGNVTFGTTAEVGPKARKMAAFGREAAAKIAPSSRRRMTESGQDWSFAGRRLRVRGSFPCKDHGILCRLRRRHGKRVLASCHDVAQLIAIGIVTADTSNSDSEGGFSQSARICVNCLRE